MGQTTLSEQLRAVEAEIAAGRPERALDLIQQVAAQYPRALAVQRVLGEVYLALRKPREALGALDRALEGNPEDARACCARAIVHQLHGNPAGALEFYHRACDINPDDQVLRAAYRELAASLGRPPYQPSRRGLARLYLRGDLLPHAIREWETLVAEQPDSLEAQVGLAEALWRSGNIPAAEERCRRIQANAPSCVKALLILAVIAHDAGNADEAQRLVRRVRELDPDQRIAQALLADRFAAGDRPLHVLIFGQEPPAYPASQPLSPQQMMAAGEAGPAGVRPRVWSRPLVQHRSNGPLSQPLPAAPRSQPLPTGPLPTGPLPTGPLPTGPLPGPSIGLSAPLGGVAQMPTAQMPVPVPPPVPVPAPRPTTLPADFHSMFAETEYMLWSREETERHPAVVPPQTSPAAPMPTAEPSRVERAPASTTLVPPALREQGFSLEETEVRAAINWVHWLQAQGARAHQGTTTTGSLAAPTPTATPLPGSGPLAGPQTAAQQATPEALRQMFDVLSSDTATLRIVDADAAPAAPVVPTNEAHAAAVPSGSAFERDDDTDSRSGVLTVDDLIASEETVNTPAVATPPQYAWPPADAASEAPEAADDEPPAFQVPSAFEAAEPEWSPAPHDTPSAPSIPLTAEPGDDVSFAATDHGATDHGAPSSAEAPAPGDGPLTLEALEQSFASSGFQSFELQPGGLAKLTGAPAQSTDAPADAQPAALSEHDATDSFERPAAPPAEPAEHVGAAHVPPVEGARAPTLLEQAPPQPAAVAEPTTPAQPSGPAADDYPGRLEQAREWLAGGRSVEALAEYRAVLKNAPDLLNDVMAQLREHVAAHPDDAEAHRLLGDAHVRQGDYLGALEAYNRAVALTEGQRD